MTGGHDQVDAFQLTIRVGLVVVEQRSAWGFDHSYPFARVFASRVLDIRAADIRVVKQHLHPFEGKQAFDETRIVEVQRVFHRLAVVECFEGLELFIG